MPQSDPQTLTVEVFSALQFYEDVASGRATSDSVRRITLDIPREGLVEVPHAQGSLHWVDGLCIQSGQTQELLEAIKNRAVPLPALSHVARPITARCLHQSARVLCSQKKTILSVLKLVKPLCAQASRSAFIGCQSCGDRLFRPASLAALLDLISRDHLNQKITLVAESSTAELLEWATAQGFSAQPVNSTAHSFTIDTLLCSPDALVGLSGTMRALWSFPGITFHCRTPDKTTTYSPAGWCPRCSHAADRPAQERLEKILTCGPREDDLSRVEMGLEISAEISVAQLLQLPASTLPLPDNHLLFPAQQILKHCGLTRASFGQLTHYMSAHDIARLAIAAGLHEARGSSDMMILDLPRAIFSRSEQTELHDLLKHSAKSHVIVILGEPFAVPSVRAIRSAPHTSRSIATLWLQQDRNDARQLYELVSGASISLLSSAVGVPNLYQLLLDQLGSTPSLRTHPVVTLESAGARPACRFIPLLPEPQLHNRLLGDELGIMERLAQLYASSLDARMAGLSAKDLLINSARKNPCLCPLCKGLGVTLRRYKHLPRPQAAPCASCKGLRFKSPGAMILFKGISYADILNKPIAQSTSTLSALSKARSVLELVSALSLDHLPLGMPVALLSSSELRRLSLIQALQGVSESKPAVIVFESPTVGLSDAYVKAIDTIRDTHPQAQHCAWIEIE